jgi:cytochrome P450
MTAVKRREPPGPPGNFLLGNAPHFQRNPLKMFLDGWRAYGDAVRFRGPKTLYLVVHPDYVKHMLEDHHLQYPHPRSFDLTFRSATGPGILDSEGEEWLRRRRMLEPVFSHDHAKPFGVYIQRSIEQMLQRWERHAQSGEPIDARAEMLAISQAMLGRCLFGSDWEQHADALSAGVTAFIARLDQGLAIPINLPDRLPIPSMRRFVAARNKFDDAVFQIIKDRRASGEEGNDLLGLFLRVREAATGQGMNDREIRDRLTQHFAAGHGTVSASLYYTAWLMAKHPDALERLRAELARVLGDRMPTIDDLPDLCYTRMVVLESMRLFPPIWIQARSPLGDDQIGDYHFPAGAFIVISSYVTHRHPEFWEDPELFDPERFSPDRSADRHPYAFFPLSRGPRDCYGGPLAMIEMQTTLAAWAQRFAPRLLSEEPLAFKLGIGLTARKPIPMMLRRL